MSIATPLTGSPLDRVDGPAKVTGMATYTAEHKPPNLAYGFPIQATVAKGRIAAIDADRARALPGVIAVLTAENAPRLAGHDDPALLVLQDDGVPYYGRYVALIVADTPEVAREAAAGVRVLYDAAPHDVVARAGHPTLYAPEKVNAGFATDSVIGDVDAALDAAPVVVDAVYETPNEHNNPMEPHATIATWSDDGVTVYDATQGPYTQRGDIASAFGIDPVRVRVLAPYVGGGFGSKAFTHPHVILAVMAAKATGRPVRVELTRQQMFANVGYRPAMRQRLRLGAGRDGALVAIAHEVEQPTSTVEEYAEQTAVATRHMYAAPNRRTTHRIYRLDLPTPSIMRAPGECPGMFALESAIDELAIACGVDPVELRIRNEPARDPEEHKPFSTRNLVACLREGARRFGWEGRDPRPGPRRDGRWYVGTGVAASTYPARRRPASALARVSADGRYTVQIAATDIGTGAWTILTQLAADALGVELGRVTMEIGDSGLPRAPGAGGSMGASSWGHAVVSACRALRERIAERGGAIPADGLEAEITTDGASDAVSRHGFGAQFCEVRIDAYTAEVRVQRMLGVFAVGRILNAKTARSQLIGGMTMGLGMALEEETIVDRRFGHFANHDLAEYHIPVNADVRDVEAIWLDEDDQHVNAMGAKGIGEIGITGAAAAIANAVHHATGIRVRRLPIHVDDLIARLR